MAVYNQKMGVDWGGGRSGLCVCGGGLFKNQTAVSHGEPLHNRFPEASWPCVSV